MSEQEQNRKINELKRELLRMHEDLKTLKSDVEPDGHISQGFEKLEEDIESFKKDTRKRFDALSHLVNRVLARQEVMLQRLTKIDDLPEE